MSNQIEERAANYAARCHQLEKEVADLQREKQRLERMLGRCLERIEQLEEERGQ